MNDCWPDGRLVQPTSPKKRGCLALVVLMLSLDLTNSCQPLVPKTTTTTTTTRIENTFSSSSISSSMSHDERDLSPSLQLDPLISRDGSRQPQTISANGTNSNAGEQFSWLVTSRRPSANYQTTARATIKRTKRQAHEMHHGRVGHGDSQDQVQADWLDLGRGLSVGSRIVIAAENQSVELTCDASESTLDSIQHHQQQQHHLLVGTTSGDLVGSRKQLKAGGHNKRASKVRELLVADVNGTLMELGLNANNSSPRADLSTIVLAKRQPIQDLAVASHQQARLSDEEPADYLVSLVFWYKDDNPAPIYTLDARQSVVATDVTFGGRLDAMNQVAQMNRRLLANAKHYNGQQQQQIRDRLRIKTDDWPVIRLQLGRVGPVQAGDYKCRVDFRRARTIKRTARLFVEVPMKELKLGPINDADTRETSSLPSDTEPAMGGSNLIRLNEDQAGEFVCRTPEGSPRPELVWFMKKPGQTASELLDELLLVRLGAQIVRGRPDVDTNRAPIRPGRVNFRKPKEDDDDDNDDAGRETPLRRVHEQHQSTLSRLQIAKLDRSLDGAQIGCRARQSRNVTAKWEPPLRQNSTARSLEANWRSDETIELTKWLELSLNLRPETVELAWLHQTSRGPSSERTETTNQPPRRAGQQPRAHNGTEMATVVGFVRAAGRDRLELVSSRDQDPLAANRLATGEAREVALIEHEPTSFVCRSRGSRPNARLGWFWLTPTPDEATPGQDSNRLPIEALPGVTILNKTNTDLSESTLNLNGGLDRTRSGLRLVCEASNDHFKELKLAVQVELDVRFRPSVKLFELDAREQKPTKTTRQQLQFECHVDSNPSINQFVLLVNERPLLRIQSEQSKTESRREKQQARRQRRRQPISETSLAKVEADKGLLPSLSLSENDRIEEDHEHEHEHDRHLVELFDQAEIKQFYLGQKRQRQYQAANETKELADENGHKFEISRDKKRFLIDLSQFGERFDDELAPPDENEETVKQLARRSSVSLTIELEQDLDFDSNQYSLDNLQLKCLASNELGESSSEWSAWQPPKCFVDKRVREQQSDKINQPLAELEQDSLLGRLRVHQIHKHNDERRLLACKLDETANDGASQTIKLNRRFVWSFVPFDQVPRQLNSLLTNNQTLTSTITVETDSNQLSELETDRLISSSRGLVSCQAKYANGRVSPSCLTLVTASGQLGQAGSDSKDTAEQPSNGQIEAPSVQDCKIEPILVDSSQDQQQQQQEQNNNQLQDSESRLAISVDCSSTPNKEALIFELGVSLATAASGSLGEVVTPMASPSLQLADLMLLDGRANETSGHHQDHQQLGRHLHQHRPLARYRGKRLLFFEGPDRDSQQQQQQQQQQQRRQSVSNGSQDWPTATLTNTRRFALIDLISAGQDSAEPNGLLFVLDKTNKDDDDDDDDDDDQAASAKDAITGTGSTNAPVTNQAAGRYSDIEGGAKEGESPERKGPNLARKDYKLGQIEAQLMASAQVHQQDDRQSSERQFGQPQMQPANGWRQQSRLMTLTEQVELLNEFVFTLRASDLVRVSEPRAIYGADLKISKRHTQDTSASKQQQDQPPLPPSFQVTRSRSSSTDAYDNNLQQQQLGSARGQATGGRLTPAGRSSKPLADDRPLAHLLDWGQSHEIGITMAAIGATLLLSALTLALIVLVLKSRNKTQSGLAGSGAGGSSGAQSELVLMRAASPTTSTSSPPTSAESRVSPIKHQLNNVLSLQDNDSFGLIHEHSSFDHHHHHQQQQHHCQVPTCECGAGEPYTSSMTLFRQHQVDYLAPPIVGRHKCPGQHQARQVRISLSPEACCSSPEDSQQYLAYFGPYSDKSGVTFGAL